ncbi:Mu transposase C-terminal domain-containing protein [Paracoccus zhejiangensis]|nr:Mu transposase C-terminal domain-containing protein [Paracoccus zhejiangensis]
MNFNFCLSVQFLWVGCSMANVGRKTTEKSALFEEIHADQAWLRATRIARELDRVLDSPDPMRVAVGQAAVELCLSTRQVYNLLARYRETRRVSSLLPRTGRQRRARINGAVEQIIADTLRELWLRPEQPDLAPIVDEIRAQCVEHGLNPPAYVTVAKRIPRLFTPEEIARYRHSSARHLHRLKPRPGYIRADRPLDVFQIDHTPADIQFVEVIDSSGLFVGRPYLTLAADVATSAITGFCLTLEHPSRLSVALCLAHAISDKRAWLRERGIDHAWPMQGRPKMIVVDSAKEFRSMSFARSCADYGIMIKSRNKGTVHRGGLVERLLGKVNALLRALPGRTGRSIADRDEYASEERARLSFAELERCIALAIIDHNLSQNARKLTVPADEWEKNHISTGRPSDDAVDVLLNFLPRKTRRITPQGISLFAIDYFESWLGPLVARRDRLAPLEVCYDPRDISRLFLRDPGTDSWKSVMRRDGVAAPVTLWQHREDRRYRREQGQKSAEEKMLLRREIATTIANTKSQKAQLRQRVRERHALAASKVHESMPLPSGAESPISNQNRPRRIFPIEDW